MKTWTRARERAALVAHVARCRFCRSLLGYSRRRQDRELLDAADTLAVEHAIADLEHEAFARGRSINGGASTERCQHRALRPPC